VDQEETRSENRMGPTTWAEYLVNLFF